MSGKLATKWGEGKNMGWWCEVLSSTGHQHCRVSHCTCPHHLPENRGEAYGDERRAPRPHSYPRADWKDRKPPGWTEAERLNKPFTRKRGWR